jgi:hypothetical protein
MNTITLDESCIGTVISETPYVKLLSIPERDAYGSFRALAQVNSSLALIEVALTPPLPGGLRRRISPMVKTIGEVKYVREAPQRRSPARTYVQLRRSVAQGIVANIERAQRQLRNGSFVTDVDKDEVADDLELIATAIRRTLHE